MSSVDELPDDEGLDKLFRKSAEEFEPPYNSEDWSNLRQRLDQTDRTALLFRLLRWGLPILLLLLTGTGIWLWQNNKQTNNYPVTPTASSEYSGKPTSLNNKSGNADQAGLEETTAAPTLSPSAEHAVEQRDKIAPTNAKSPVSISSREGGLIANQPAETESQSVNNTRKQRKIVDNSVDKGLTVDKRGKNQAKNTPLRIGKRVPNALSAAPNSQLEATYQEVKPPSSMEQRADVGTPTVEPSSDQLENNASNSVPNELMAERFHFSPAPDLLSSRPLSLSDSGLINQTNPYYEAPRPKQTPRLSPLSVRFQFTPDLNFIGGSGPAISPNVGAFVEYRFMSRWVIQVGALRAVKKYYASIEDYKLSSYWRYKDKPTRIDANCSIIDIPINLRFDVLASDKQRWFVSSGVSSYIMKKEYYDYEYENPTTTNPPKYWQGKTGRVNASHLNFSVGYERQLSRRLSWQVEPFLKTPLKGVGYGKVRLLTTGIFLSARYNI